MAKFTNQSEARPAQRGGPLSLLLIKQKSERKMTKSEASFRFTAQRLFDSQKRVFFWTFTFVNVQPDERGYVLWAQFLKQWRNAHLEWLPGVWVAELHDSHGIHFHVLLGLRVCVQMTKRMAARFGFGHIGVKVATKGAGPYLAKYLSKQGPIAPGRRRWSAFGGLAPCRVNQDLETDSGFVRSMQAVAGGVKLTYRETQKVHAEVMHGGELQGTRLARAQLEILANRMGVGVFRILGSAKVREKVEGQKRDLAFRSSLRPTIQHPF